MQRTDHALCVDLDGTLLRSDMLYESLLTLLACNPLYVFLLPFWLLRGKAALKREIASRVSLLVEHLPYDARAGTAADDTTTPAGALFGLGQEAG